MGRPTIIDPGDTGGGGSGPLPTIGTTGAVIGDVEVLAESGVVLIAYPEQRRVVVSAPDFVPVGAILGWTVGVAAPTGFLACDGAAVSRTDYADLFAVVGTAYGVGDGSTTFNVPNTAGFIIKT